jgi:hypothetical protein
VFTLENNAGQEGVFASYGKHYDDATFNFDIPTELTLGLGTSTPAPSCFFGAPFTCIQRADASQSPVSNDTVVSLDANPTPGAAPSGPRRFTRVVFSVP